MRAVFANPAGTDVRLETPAGRFAVKPDDPRLDGLTIEPFAVAPPMPPLTPRQLRLGLLSLGVTGAQVEAQIEAIEDGTEREAALIEWRYSTTYERGHPLIATIGAALGLSEPDIDAAWSAAAEL